MTKKRLIIGVIVLLIIWLAASLFTGCNTYSTTSRIAESRCTCLGTLVSNDPKTYVPNIPITEYCVGLMVGKTTEDLR